MGQEEVLNFLRDHPNEWFSSKQMVEIMNTDPHRLHVNLNRLRRWNHILFKSKVQTKCDMSSYVYKFKDDWLTFLHRWPKKEDFSDTSVSDLVRNSETTNLILKTPLNISLILPINDHWLIAIPGWPSEFLRMCKNINEFCTTSVLDIFGMFFYRCEPLLTNLLA